MFFFFLLCLSYLLLLFFLFFLFLFFLFLFSFFLFFFFLIFIFVVFEKIGFRLVCLSFCIYNRTKHIKHIKHIKRFENKTYKQTKHNRNTIFPSRNLRYIYSRRFLGWISCIFISMFFSKFYCFVMFCMFLPSLFKLCLNTTQYTTLNTTKLEIGLFMTCVNCSK